MVPLMLQTIADALNANAEDECRDALEVFVEIAETQTRFLRRNIQDCVTGMLSIASNAALDESLRHLALEFLLTVAENAPSTARKLPNFTASTVQVALTMMLDVQCDSPEEIEEWENEDEDEDDTDVTNYDVGEEADSEAEEADLGEADAAEAPDVPTPVTQTAQNPSQADCGSLHSHDEHEAFANDASPSAIWWRCPQTTTCLAIRTVS